jgi:hypothetical protein
MAKRIERQGSVSVPYTTAYPQIRGGVCEHCGVIDNLQPSEVQYRLCPHFRDMGEIQCSYCPEGRDPVDVIKKHAINVHGHPDKPDTVVVVCSSYECSEKHLARFKLS